MNRRGFIKGLAGLAALAVVPGTAVLAAKTQQERFLAAAATGLIEHQTFYLDGPVVLSGIDGLVIRHCTFLLRLKSGESMVSADESCRNVLVTSCIFRQR